MEEVQDWTLATFLRRLVAQALDTLLFYLPLLVFVLTLGFGFTIVVDQGSSPVDGSSPVVGKGALKTVLIVVMTVSLALMLGYVIWWLIALGRGQTPGKQLVGIRVIKAGGEPSGWGYTFVREFIIKGVLGGLLSSITGGLYWVVDHLWPLWDGNSQALHDKMMSTLVVQSP